MLPNTPKIAIPIDADNISPKEMPLIFEIAQTKGKILYYFASGTKKSLKGWKNTIEDYRFRVITAPVGENVADKIIVRECAEIALERPDIDTFCIVSNDGGFAPICHLLRSWGKQVFIIGNTHAAKPLRKDFEFYSLQTTPVIPEKTLNLMKLLEQAFASQNEEWVNLSMLKMILQGIHPDFQGKDYEAARFSKLLETLPDFIELKKVGLNPYARLRSRKTKN